MKMRRSSILWVFVLSAAGCGQSLTQPGGADAIAYWKKQVNDRRTNPQALRALVKIGPPAIPALTDLLRTPDPVLRASVAKALGKMGKEAAPALIELLNDRDGMVEECAGRLGDYGARRQGGRSLGDPAAGRSTPAIIRGGRLEKDRSRRPGRQFPPWSDSATPPTPTSASGWPRP